MLSQESRPLSLGLWPPWVAISYSPEAFISALAHRRLQKQPSGARRAPGLARPRGPIMYGAGWRLSLRRAAAELLLAGSAELRRAPWLTARSHGAYWLQVCSLTQTERFSHDISCLAAYPPACSLLSSLPALEQGTGSPLLLQATGPWAATARRHLPVSSGTQIPQAPGEQRAGEVPAAGPGPLLLFQVQIFRLMGNLPQPAGCSLNSVNTTVPTPSSVWPWASPVPSLGLSYFNYKMSMGLRVQSWPQAPDFAGEIFCSTTDCRF